METTPRLYCATRPEPLPRPRNNLIVPWSFTGVQSVRAEERTTLSPDAAAYKEEVYPLMVYVEPGYTENG